MKPIEDITQWYEDAFFRGIRITFNERCFTSSIKLLVSAIDAMAFVAYGDTSGKHFIQWCNQFMNLSNVGITAEELWEHRNALLHMTTLESRKVKKGLVRRILPIVGPKELSPGAHSESGDKIYPFYTLVTEFAQGLSRYTEAVNADETLRESFCANWPKLIESDGFHGVEYGPKMSNKLRISSDGEAVGD
jgi:hypothetical protein